MRVVSGGAACSAMRCAFQRRARSWILFGLHLSFGAPRLYSPLRTPCDVSTHVGGLSCSIAAFPSPSLSLFPPVPSRNPPPFNLCRGAPPGVCAGVWRPLRGAQARLPLHATQRPGGLGVPLPPLPHTHHPAQRAELGTSRAARVATHRGAVPAVPAGAVGAQHVDAEVRASSAGWCRACAGWQPPWHRISNPEPLQHHCELPLWSVYVWVDGGLPL